MFNYKKFFKGWSKDVLQSCPSCGAEMDERVSQIGHWTFECDSCDLITHTGSKLEVTLADVLLEAYQETQDAVRKAEDTMHEILSAGNRKNRYRAWKIRRDHAAWSELTFGQVGPVGPLKHLSAEALEAAADPQDLSEWADLQFLLWDAQRRAGISDERIVAAMEEKLRVNMARQWPAPKDGEPRMHIKEEGEQ